MIVNAASTNTVIIASEIRNDPLVWIPNIGPTTSPPIISKNERTFGSLVTRIIQKFPVCGEYIAGSDSTELSANERNSGSGFTRPTNSLARAVNIFTRERSSTSDSSGLETTVALPITPATLSPLPALLSFTIC